MNIAIMILLACPVFLASILVANPAQASTTKMISVASSQPIEQLVTLLPTRTLNPIMDQLGCNCAVCFESKFQMLQGRLPLGDF